MKKLTMAAIALALLGAAARAQETPAADVAVGYSYIKAFDGSSLTAHGGTGSVAVNVNHWLGAVGDFSLYHSALVGPGLAAGTYTFGPRFSYRHWNRVTPFAQGLLGGVRYASNGFVFAGGGGADFGIGSGGRFALRPQVEYFGFRANSGITNTFRVSIGTVFRIGKK